MLKGGPLVLGFLFTFVILALIAERLGLLERERFLLHLAKPLPAGNKNNHILMRHAT